MEIPDIDFKNSSLTIKAVNSKSKKSRYIGFDQKSGLGKMLKSLKRRKDSKEFGPQVARAWSRRSGQLTMPVGLSAKSARK